MTKPAAEVFLSYKAEDRARLQPLVAALEAEGFSVWWDAHIGGGTNWRQDIQEHLDAAKCVIVAWSKRSVGPEGEFVRDEAMRARRHHTYLPIRIDEIEPPLGFGEVQALSLKNWKGDRFDPRLIAVVDAVRERITGEHVEYHPVLAAEPQISRRAVVAGGIGIGGIAIAGVGGWLLSKPDAANAKRIAVLPFANLSGDHDQAYFSDGIAEELRSALVRIGLEVIGRTSSDAVKDLDAKTVANKLGVANILTGSVRRSPEVIRVNAQLVSGKDGVERWAQSYDRSPGDAIKIQTDIATNVAQALSVALGKASHAALTLGGTADSVAQDLILQGRKLLREADGPDALRRVLQLTNQAIARDPNYADAYIEKVNVLVNLGTRFPFSRAEAASQLAQAETAAKKAMALAPRLGSTHAALAELALGRLDFGSGLQHLKQAVALSPEDPEVLATGARELPWLGDAPGAFRLADRSIRLDPLNGVSYRRKSSALLVLRRYSEAVEAGRQALEIAPDQHTAHVEVGYAFVLLGQLAQAKAEFEAMPANYPLRLAGEALVAARSDDAVDAERLILRMKELAGPARYQYGQIYVQLGNLDRAFEEFGKAVEAKTPGLIFLKADPFLDPIRGDPRFTALVRKLNFP